MLVADSPTGNITNYFVPEFYSYISPPNDAPSEVFWYGAIDCIDLYTQIFGSTEKIPPSLATELEPLDEFRWLCPNITEMVLMSDPYNYDFGQNFNFVLNYCDVTAIRNGITDPNCVASDSQEMTDFYKEY